MARYSDKKEAFALVLTAKLAPIARAAAAASTADRALLAYAVDGCKYAQQWTKDTTEASRRLVASNAAMLEKGAREAQANNVCLALLSYSQALSAFVACDYRGSIKHAEAGARLAGG